MSNKRKREQISRYDLHLRTGELGVSLRKARTNYCWDFLRLLILIRPETVRFDFGEEEKGRAVKSHVVVVAKRSLPLNNWCPQVCNEHNMSIWGWISCSPASACSRRLLCALLVAQRRRVMNRSLKLYPHNGYFLYYAPTHREGCRQHTGVYCYKMLSFSNRVAASDHPTDV